MNSVSDASSSMPGVLVSLLSAGEAIYDDVLDLWAALNEGERPGFCVGTFYKLQRMLPHYRREMSDLRDWLESRIEVRAWARQEQRIDQLPLDLACAHELEDYCQHKMREAYQSGQYTGCELEMTFGFRAA